MFHQLLSSLSFRDECRGKLHGLIGCWFESSLWKQSSSMDRAMSLFLQFCRRVFLRRGNPPVDFGANAVGTTLVASSSLAGSTRRSRSSVGRAVNCFSKTLSHRLFAGNIMKTMNVKASILAIRFTGEATGSVQEKLT